MSDGTGMLVLDGSEGEGGGQILRSALSLSLVTGRPFCIENIRALRHPAGLRPQHLACVRGAEAIGQGRSEGAAVGSSRLVFEPGPVKPGDYLLEVGTAGSTPLLFQCLFFPLALAGGGELRLRGGTHVPFSPSYHYLARVWLTAMNAYGLHAHLKLRHAGFYPRGGGEWSAQVLAPGATPDRVELPSRGTLGSVQVTSMVGNLPFHIAERQGRAAASALRERGIVCEVDHLPLPTTGSQGSVVFIRVEFEHTLAGFTALGERGRRAEEVGVEAVDQFSRFMESAGALDAHLADQILLPAALLAAGRLGPSASGTTRFTTERVTGHLTTNAKLLERFLPIAISVESSGLVRVAPRKS